MYSVGVHPISAVAVAERNVFLWKMLRFFRTVTKYLFLNSLRRAAFDGLLLRRLGWGWAMLPAGADVPRTDERGCHAGDLFSQPPTPGVDSHRRAKYTLYA